MLVTGKAIVGKAVHIEAEKNSEVCIQRLRCEVVRCEDGIAGVARESMVDKASRIICSTIQDISDGSMSHPATLWSAR